MRIPFVISLWNRGINAYSYSCSSFIDGVDYAYHILLGCPYAISVRTKILSCCRLNQVSANTMEELVTYATTRVRCPKKRDIFTAFYYRLLWNLWKTMNDRIFNFFYYSYKT